MPGMVRLTVVLEKLFDQVDVSEHHAPAAISFETERRERFPKIQTILRHSLHGIGLYECGICVPVTFTLLQQIQVFIPFIANDFTAGETPDRNELHGADYELTGRSPSARWATNHRDFHA